MSARAAGLAILLAAGVGLLTALILHPPASPVRTSLAPAFRVAGEPAKVADRALGRMVPVGEVDERELGEVLHARFANREPSRDPDATYLEAVMAGIAPSARKPFRYRAYLVESSAPNAMALPGGVILATRGLLGVLHSEAELAAVLAHEVGHVELGHSLDAVRYSLADRKMGTAPLGQLAGLAETIVLRHAFSKVQEEEADAYSFTFLCHSTYDPAAMGESFASLAGSGVARPEAPHADPLRDYLASHPPLALRQAVYAEEAAAWWRNNAGQSRYCGRENHARRVARAQGLDHPDEWRTAGP